MQRDLINFEKIKYSRCSNDILVKSLNYYVTLLIFVHADSKEIAYAFRQSY